MNIKRKNDEAVLPRAQEDPTPLQERIYSEDYQDIIAIKTNEIIELVDRLVGMENTIDLGKLFMAVYVKRGQRDILNSISIAQPMWPLLYTQMDIGVLDASGISQMQNHPFVPLTGKGTIVGILDSGIDYRHEAFIREDGTSKILSIWDQSAPSGAAPSDTAPYGTVYSREMINRALLEQEPLAIVPQNDTDGHGTFISGIAAGNRQANFSGAAPDADIMVVKLKKAKNFIKEDSMIFTDSIPVYQENDIMRAIDYLVLEAEKANKPIAICVALGTNQGSHDSLGYLTRMLSNIAFLKGITLCIAAGNEGNAAHHTSGFLTAKGDTANVELRVGQDEKGFSVYIWTLSPDLLSISLTSPTGESIEKVPLSLKGAQTYDLVLERARVTVIYDKYTNLNGDHQAVIQFRDPTPGIWVITLHGERVVSGEYNIWLPQKGLVSDDTVFLNLSPFKTVTDPGNSQFLITVGAYNFSDNSIYIDSSRGFSRTNTITPSFIAPGVNVLGPAPGNTYVTRSGTSISAAVSTGACAQLLEWGIIKGEDPDLNSLSCRAVLVSGCIRQSGVPYPNQQSGYGQLNLYNSFKEMQTTSLTALNPTTPYVGTQVRED